ncbi:histidinol-phosphate transaminase [Puniceicoccaceae bacterium K14]|nr:histidinol-phosphate transaminase [Puniceicoccaceae bacterium K14]
MKSSKPMIDLALPHVQALKGYTPGFQPKEAGWVKLNTNESPYPTSPMVEEALREVSLNSLRLYPDPLSMPLREEVARLHGLKSSNVIIGNGSDDVLNLLVRAFSSARNDLAVTMPSYSLYPVLCAIQNTEVTTLPFDRSMKLPLDEISKCESGILFFTTPNAPTAVGFSNEDFRKALSSFDGLIVFDEAYADFAEENAVELLAEFPNAVVTRTLSKSYGLAGLRVGYALAHEEVISILDRVRDSYNVNSLSQAGAIAAIKDQSYLNAIVGKIKYTRDYYISQFQEMGWFTYKSQANFIFTEPVTRSGAKGAEVASDLFEFFKQHKILVRYFKGHALTESFVRISVGDEDQMLYVSETIEKWLNKE